MAEEHGLKHYIEQEQSLDTDQLESAPTPSEIVHLTLIAILGISSALIIVFIWTQHFLPLEQALLLTLVTAGIGIAAVTEIAKETRRLQESFEHQIWRKYTYWMPPNADIPENHLKKTVYDTTKD